MFSAGSDALCLPLQMSNKNPALSIRLYHPPHFPPKKSIFPSKTHFHLELSGKRDFANSAPGAMTYWRHISFQHPPVLLATLLPDILATVFQIRHIGDRFKYQTYLQKYFFFLFKDGYGGVQGSKRAYNLAKKLL